MSENHRLVELVAEPFGEIAGEAEARRILRHGRAIRHQLDAGLADVPCLKAASRLVVQPGQYSLHKPDLADDELRRLPHVRYIPLF